MAIQVGLVNISLNLNLSLKFDRNNNKNLLKIGFVKHGKDNKTSFRINERLIKSLYKKWYILSTEKEFEVEVYDKSTGEIDIHYSYAVKLFLEDMKGDTFIKGFAYQYIEFSNECNEFIVTHKLFKKNSSIIKCYKELYFCLRTIIKIIQPRTAYLAEDKRLVKVFLPQADDFHFKIDINANDAKERFDGSKFNNILFAVELGNKILCEQILPGLYLKLGYQSKEFFNKYPFVRDINYYHACLE